ncbi:MAG TPA: response regulator [Terriglobales bacterium]|nr:response regulator [Terriglobales bacterium]
MNAAKVILIVDGSPIMRRVIERALRLAGIDLGQIVEATDGTEALALTQQRHFDLILTDINLQGINGLELLRQLRQAEATSTVPVVIITSEAGESHVLEALSLGAQGYIRKPFTADQVKEYIAPLFRMAALA